MAQPRSSRSPSQPGHPVRGPRRSPQRVVTRPERCDGIPPHHGSLRHLRQRAPVRPPEPERVVRPALDPIALLVHRPVMPAAQQREVRERRRAPVGPVVEVMALAEADATAREAAAAVSMLKRPP